MVLLVVLAPMLDDIGLSGIGPHSVLGYHYTPAAVTAIIVSALLGVLVSLSTFLVIGTTSSLTYNVVGHSKTVNRRMIAREGGSKKCDEHNRCILWGGRRVRVGLSLCFAICIE